MRPALALLAIAALVLTARRLRRPTPLLEADAYATPHGMPTTWADAPGNNSWTLGHGWYVEFAPTSQN